MEGIYVLSSPERAENNIYKIGRHTGSQEALRKRYNTALISPIIYFYYPCDNSRELENKIKDYLYEHRISNDDNRKTEWVKLDLFTIINDIKDLITSTNIKFKPLTQEKINEQPTNNKFLMWDIKYYNNEYYYLPPNSIKYKKISINDYTTNILKINNNIPEIETIIKNNCYVNIEPFINEHIFTNEIIVHCCSNNKKSIKIHGSNISAINKITVTKELIETIFNTHYENSVNSLINLIQKICDRICNNYVKYQTELLEKLPNTLYKLGSNKNDKYLLYTYILLGIDIFRRGNYLMPKIIDYDNIELC